ncbi:MAG: hypothetical protein AAF268_13105 [Cyanobacteria bacterium P01_A01_bin.3]
MSAIGAGERWLLACLAWMFGCFHYACNGSGSTGKGAIGLRFGGWRSHRDTGLTDTIRKKSGFSIEAVTRERLMKM